MNANVKRRATMAWQSFADTHHLVHGRTHREPERGDRVDELLRYVHYDTDALLERIRTKLAASDLPADRARELLTELENGLSAYTYLQR